MALQSRRPVGIATVVRAPRGTAPGARQRGTIAVLAALLLPLVLSVSALAIDVASVMVVRNELQNAADAAVLAGVQCLYPRTECGNLTSTWPDWTTSRQRAASAVASNAADGATLQTASVDTGYWNLTGSPSGLQLLPMTPKTNDTAAIRVTIRKTGSENGGGVKLYLGKVFGIDVMPLSASAVAVITSPGNVGAGGLFPIAMSKCMYDNYWDATKGSPKLATNASSLPGQSIKQTVGQPYQFYITSGYKSGSCDGGDWTTFAQDLSSTSAVQTLIQSGNPTTLSVGDGTWIQPGSKTALYALVNACSAAGDRSCEFVTIPVTNQVANHAYSSVSAFACLRILSANGGSGKYVLVQMSNQCVNPKAGGSGPGYGVFSTPKLVS